MLYCMRLSDTCNFPPGRTNMMLCKVGTVSHRLVSAGGLGCWCTCSHFVICDGGHWRCRICYGEWLRKLHKETLDMRGYLVIRAWCLGWQCAISVSLGMGGLDGMWWSVINKKRSGNQKRGPYCSHCVVRTWSVICCMTMCSHGVNRNGGLTGCLWWCIVNWECFFLRKGH